MARTVYGGRQQARPSVLAGRYTAVSNPSPPGIHQGVNPGVGPAPGIGRFSTMGPGLKPAGRRPGMSMRIGDEGYLWILIAIEYAVMYTFRNYFRSRHGG